MGKRIDKLKVQDLIGKGLKDSEIAKELNCSKDGIYLVRKRNNFERDSFSTAKSIPLTLLQVNFLTGCLLGDGHMRIDKGCINPRFKCDHGIKQVEYCRWKFELLESLQSKFKIYTRLTPDKRNGIYYTSATVEVNNNPEFLNIYNNFYNNNKKVLNKNIYDNFNELSLAVMFMDDGYKSSHSIMISTDCFSKLELNEFNDFIFDKFKIRFNIISKNKLYLPAKFYKTFKDLVLPFIHPTMMYKFPK